MQNIELTIKDDDQGCFAISLVDKPAIEEDFIFLSEISVELQVANDEKREVVGLALVPNKQILRRIKDKEFTISFSEETIAKVQELYLKKNYNNNVTVDHDHNVEGVTLIESWIVEDEKHDKSNIYKLDAVKGSWVVKMKVYNEEVWQQIKDGKFKGFSIEGKFDGLDQLEAESHEDIINEIKELLKSI
jgi:hypothetical protein